MTQTTKTCPVCATSFIAYHKRTKYCSTACRNRAHHLKRSAPDYVRSSRIDIHTRAIDKLKNFEDVLEGIVALNDESE